MCAGMFRGMHMPVGDAARLLRDSKRKKAENTDTADTSREI